MSRILLDFDGTVIDFWARYHAVFCKLTGCNVRLDIYKQLKRMCKTDTKLAEELDVELPADYRDAKLKLLESDEYLDMDTLLISRDKLIDFVNKNDVIVLSRRNDESALKREFVRLNLSELLPNIVCINSSKREWVRDNIKDEAIIIGDDVRDLHAGEFSKIRAVMVLTGIGTKEAFDEEKIPYELVESLEEYIEK